jgi:hypothetical protein
MPKRAMPQPMEVEVNVPTVPTANGVSSKKRRRQQLEEQEERPASPARAVPALEQGGRVESRRTAPPRHLEDLPPPGSMARWVLRVDQGF